MTVTLRPTIRQVAELAGVSRMTVSRVLSDENHKVSEETRVRVLKAVRELEYVPVAQPVTQSRKIENHVVGLVFVGTQFEDQWGLPTFVGFREVAERCDYDLLVLARSRRDWMAEQNEMQFLDRRSDGLVFIGLNGQRQVLEALVKRNMPVVSCYADDVPPEVPYVVVDNHGAMRQAVDYLHHKGHERILFLNANRPLRSDFHARWCGYEAAMQEKNLEPVRLQFDQYPSESSAECLMKTIRNHRITAIVCHNDSSAIFAWDVAKANGLNIPRDLSITGMDDLAIPAQRGLTSIHFSCEEAGRRALEMVIDTIQGRECKSRQSVVPVELVERLSVASPS